MIRHTAGTLASLVQAAIYERFRLAKKVQFRLQNRYFKKTQEAGVYYIKKHRPWKALGSDSPYGFSSRLLLIE